MDFIDLKTQQLRIREDIDERMGRVLTHGRYIMGPEIGELEEKLAEFTGSKHCISVSSGTDALLLALMALGIKAGDEVITTPFSFFATAEVILLLGAKPVFVDIGEDYNLNVDLLEAAITERTAAVIPVSLYGQCYDYDYLVEVTSRHGVPIVEDAAQSFGATYKARKACTLGDISCTSFFPSKPLGCYGDGGACFTDSDDLADALKSLRVHGQERRYVHNRLGINGRLDTLQAAVLLAKMEIFADELEARDAVAGRYSRLFREQGYDAIVPTIRQENFSAWAQYTIRPDNRESVVEACRVNDIPTAVHYPVLMSAQPAVDIPGEFPVAEAWSRRVVSLPMHPYLSESDQDQVVAAVISGL